MAIFVPGIRCSISGDKIESASDAVMFPSFVANEADPLYIFSDAVVRKAVFAAHPLAARAQARYEEFEHRTHPQARSCLICGQRITDPENYIGLGHLVDAPDHDLYSYNYAHFHRTCLTSWSELLHLIHELETMNRSGVWKGDALRTVIEDLASTRAA
jgi:hypothetical protein